MKAHSAVSQPPLVEDDDLARSRNIKPGFFKNDDLADLGPEAMLLFAGLWTLADRAGRLEDRPKRIKAEIFPYFDYDVDALLNQLSERGFVVRYEVDGARYVQVVNFDKHQNPHKDERASAIPAPGEHHASTVQAPDWHSSNRADSLNLIPDSLPLIPDCLEGEQDAPAKPKRASQIPEYWLPTISETEWAYGEGFDTADITRETERFRDHHRAKGNTFKDIGLAWKNWMRRSREYQPRASPASNGHRESAAAVFARMAMEDG